jgi:hypothetical protein
LPGLASYFRFTGAADSEFATAASVGIERKHFCFIAQAFAHTHAFGIEVELNMRNLRDQEVYDNELRRQAQLDRANKSAAGGVALGIAIAGLVGAGIAAYLLSNKQPEAQKPQQNTVIERTKELVPVPQPKAPDVKAPDVNITVPSSAPVPNVKAPDVNITVPNPAPAQQAPASGANQSDSGTRSSSSPASVQQAPASGSNQSDSSARSSSNSGSSQGNSSTSSSNAAPTSASP